MAVKKSNELLKYPWVWKQDAAYVSYFVHQREGLLMEIDKRHFSDYPKVSKSTAIESQRQMIWCPYPFRILPSVYLVLTPITFHTSKVDNQIPSATPNEETIMCWDDDDDDDDDFYTYYFYSIRGGIWLMYKFIMSFLSCHSCALYYLFTSWLIFINQSNKRTYLFFILNIELLKTNFCKYI